MITLRPGLKLALDYNYHLHGVIYGKKTNFLA